jgi:hypothetical protein
VTNDHGQAIQRRWISSWSGSIWRSLASEGNPVEGDEDAADVE